MIPTSPAGRLDGSGNHHYFPRHPRGQYVVIAHAEGVYLYDEEGRQILDGASGAAVACLGHGNRRLIERMKAQAASVAFAHTSTFVTRPLLDLASRIARYTADPAAHVYFVSGGSEATETALKIARTYQVAAGHPDRYAVISRAISYHGATMGALSMTGVLKRRHIYEPLLSQFPRVATCYCYRCPVGRDPDWCKVECADEVERAILAHNPDRIAGFIVEPVIGSSAPGVTAHEDYMARVAAACRRHGVLLIADEVMSGVGRTGRFFAMEHYGVTPDIIAISKGISSGYFPLAAVIVSGHVFDTVRRAGSGEFVHGFTYAGSPIGAAVGLEVLDILEEEQLVARVARLGDLLLDRLQTLRSCAMVGDIRGKGLLVGVEFVADRATRQPFPAPMGVATRVLQACLAEGLAVYPGGGSVNGLSGDHIMIAPPYIITEAQIEELVAKLARAVEKVQAQVDPALAIAAAVEGPAIVEGS
ncbi:MAG: aspartate aminotransferase family protein [Acidobacteria bacterium]|nr:aspartate aminotransferase family protein [Acidobacteriota bacterium]